MGSDADLQQSPMLPQMESFLYNMLGRLLRVVAVRQCMHVVFWKICRLQFMSRVS